MRVLKARLCATSASLRSLRFFSRDPTITAETQRTQRRPRLFLVLSLLIFVPTLHAQDTPADNWSQFRGNSRNTGVSDAKVPSDLKLLWTFEAGDSIESSAAVVGGTVFVGSQKGELVSLNLDNGASTGSTMQVIPLANHHQRIAMAKSTLVILAECYMP